ncbi:polysaccharide deacetylase family protein [Paenibacillus cymbidii]|uniref:polysaccharide deacetylase family protein n=1 Tax=Paenibacillus cymbidii TaxID=1639034 RepID=UPI001081B69E|nr:polysaccharide deacetylase family protein [Paenibacillus cymbidii]
MIRFDRFPQGKHKAVTLSYDDGREFDRRMVEIMNRHGIRGTFHLNSSRLSLPGHVESAELADLFDGHEVSAHTVNHPFLHMSPPETIATETLNDRRELENLIGYPIKGMSYPYGSWNQEVVAILRATGMEYARTTQSSGVFDMPADFLAWKPTCHHREMLAFAQKLIDLQMKHTRMALLYVWGHSYEFDNDGNWQQLEQFCRLVGSQKDIWFATNSEIVGYMQAIQRLRCSASGQLVHNPSAISVWFSVNGNAVEVQAGETRKLAHC